MPQVKPTIVRAVHANVGVEAWYRTQLQWAIREMSQSMLHEVRACWREHRPTIGMAQDANPSWLMRKALTKWGGIWERRLDKLADELGKKFADQSIGVTETAMRFAFAEAGFTVKFRPSRGSLEVYQAVLAENVNLIKSIPQQYLTQVQSQVWQSVMKGADMGELTAAIEKQYGIAWRRAAFIARDQNNKAKAIIENERRSELGITEAIWQHSGAGKEPRPEHVKFSGKRYELVKGAYLEGKWVWPGTEPNCRCTSRAIIPGFG